MPAEAPQITGTDLSTVLHEAGEKLWGHQSSVEFGAVAVGDTSAAIEEASSGTYVRKKKKPKLRDDENAPGVEEEQEAGADGTRDRPAPDEGGPAQGEDFGRLMQVLRMSTRQLRTALEALEVKTTTKHKKTQLIEFMVEEEGLPTPTIKGQSIFHVSADQLKKELMARGLPTSNLNKPSMMETLVEVRPPPSACSSSFFFILSCRR